MFRILLLCVSFLSVLSALGQQDTLAKYGSGFRFKDGIYLSPLDFRDNCPSYPRNKVYDKMGKQRLDLDPKESYYVVNEDSLIRLEFDSIWGLCENGQVYVQHNSAFDRLIIVGKLCHIIHREEVIDFNANYGVGVGTVPVRREVQVEYLIDLESGEKVPFNEDNLSFYMQDDPVIFNSYELLTRKEKRKRQYVFLHRYNTENPVYFLISGCH